MALPPTILAPRRRKPSKEGTDENAAPNTLVASEIQPGRRKASSFKPKGSHFFCLLFQEPIRSLFFVIV